VDGWYGETSIEIFEDLTGAWDELFVNSTRLDLGVGKAFGRRARVELHYIYISARVNLGDEFTLNDNVLRLRLYYDFTRIGKGG
jgi:hypothetical protein